MVADWCWTHVKDMPKKGRSNEQKAYRSLLEGKQARDALGQFRDMAGEMTL